MDFFNPNLTVFIEPVGNGERRNAISEAPLGCVSRVACWSANSRAPLLEVCCCKRGKKQQQHLPAFLLHPGSVRNIGAIYTRGSRLLSFLADVFASSAAAQDFPAPMCGGRGRGLCLGSLRPGMATQKEMHLNQESFQGASLPGHKDARTVAPLSR